MPRQLPDNLTIDVDSLTLGELEDLEKTGADLKNMESARTITALLWVVAKRSDPEFTLDDARQVKVTALNKAVVGGEPDPKETPVSEA